MNLARGFAYSGTPSISMSLWSVNDETTAQLMQHYYQYIEAGFPTHQALRTAKLDFLQLQSDKAKLHPFYWAAFVQVGSTSPIHYSSGFSMYWFIILGLLLLFLLIFFVVSRKRG
jgi:CHAT domain-containing protein